MLVSAIDLIEWSRGKDGETGYAERIYKNRDDSELVDWLNHLGKKSGV
jgi:hypothetical protein